MIRFTKRYVNTISLIISIIIFFILNNCSFIWAQIDSSNLKSNQFQENIVQENKVENKQNSVKKETNETKKQVSENTIKVAKEENKVSTVQWSIEIPKISLKAEIAEGTSKEVLDKYVGHFEETSKEKGNIGLAAHNRGYKVNYFQNLKKLKEGDEIIYKYKNTKKTYIVKTLKIIKDTDWSYLEETEENTITLITCVENEPEYRRCVQGIEKK